MPRLAGGTNTGFLRLCFYLVEIKATFGHPLCPTTGRHSHLPLAKHVKIIITIHLLGDICKKSQLAFV